MKLVEFTLQEQTYHLLLTGAALFDAYDRFGDAGDLLERVGGTTRESFNDTVWMLVKLCQQGEAYRRHMGEEKLPMLTVEAAMRTMLPPDVVRARAAIRSAFAVGFGRTEENEERDVDLGLIELQKKTGLASPGLSGWSARRNFWGFLTRKP